MPGTGWRNTSSRRQRARAREQSLENRFYAAHRNGDRRSSSHIQDVNVDGAIPTLRAGASLTHKIAPMPRDSRYGIPADPTALEHKRAPAAPNMRHVIVSVTSTT